MCHDLQTHRICYSNIGHDSYFTVKRCLKIGINDERNGISTEITKARLHYTEDKKG